MECNELLSANPEVQFKVDLSKFNPLARLFMVSASDA